MADIPSKKRTCLMMSDLQSGATQVEYVLWADHVAEIERLKQYKEWAEPQIVQHGADRLTIERLRDRLAACETYDYRKIIEESDRLRAALVSIGEQATVGLEHGHGDCPATFACSAILIELCSLDMLPDGWIEV